MFDGNECLIIYNGRVLVRMIHEHHLYRLKQRKLYVNAAVSNSAKCAHEWHAVLGHRNLKDVRKLQKLVVGMEIKECEHSDECEVCFRNKSKRDSFPQQSLTLSTEVLDMIHTDVCGPLPVQTPSGKAYVLTLIDDFSKYTFVHLLAKKSEVPEKIMNFVHLMKNQRGKAPKVIRSDRGGEYVNSTLESFFESNGILSNRTCPYTPQQNGKSERFNLTLLNMVRCMLSGAELPNKFWGEAVNTAAYLYNRLPIKNSDETPFERWTGEKPDISCLQEFGRPTYAHIPKEQRNKLENTSERLVFVGYEEGAKGYRLLNAKTPD